MSAIPQLTWDKIAGFIDADGQQVHQLVTNSTGSARRRDGELLGKAYAATYAAGINPEGIKGLVEALGYALDILESQASIGYMPAGGECEGNWIHVVEGRNKARAAIANLKLEETK